MKVMRMNVRKVRTDQDTVCEKFRPFITYIASITAATRPISLLLQSLVRVGRAFTHGVARRAM